MDMHRQRLANCEHATTNKYIMLLLFVFLLLLVGGSIAGQNRPLFLSRDRYAQLEKLYAEHKVRRGGGSRWVL
jgi:hypothetical protein